MLQLYSLFHLNLMYSAITKHRRPEVIQKCYWPLLDLAQGGVPIAIEATAVTLKAIAELDNRWILQLKELLDRDEIEFVGSGYTQLIGPLVPWQVNQWNQQHGLLEYERLLSFRPQIALVNEMAYSSGLIGHYLKAGYEAIVMDWNNPYKYHSEWPKELQYHAQIATSCEGDIAVIWSNFIAFQKFQRITHGELSEQSYFEWLGSRIGTERRYFSLYSGDAEIFDFRPGRYTTEAAVSKNNEWKRIEALYQTLSNRQDIHLVRLKSVLEDKSTFSQKSLMLESPEQPIPVKKQEKYNIIRWALTGRDDQNLNTACFRLFEQKKDTDDVSQQRRLCSIWSSDYRTHITDDRWMELNNDVAAASVTVNPTVLPTSASLLRPDNLPYEKEALSINQSDSVMTIQSEAIFLKLNLQRGMTILECTFPRVTGSPLFGTLEHGYYEDISFAADFYTGHTVIERPAKHKVTDLTPVTPQIWINERELILRAEQESGKLKEITQLRLSLVDGRIAIEKSLQFDRRRVGIIRPMHVTFFPEAFSTDSIFYATHNGGKCQERYSLEKSNVYHSESVSPLISAKHGLGATEGVVVVGDANLEVHCKHDNSVGYVIPAIKYTRVDGDGFFLRLEYSAQEMDETFRENDEPVVINTRFELSAHKGIQVTQ